MENIRQSLYELIGVQANASQDEVENACLSLGELYRPDRYPGDAHCAARFASVEKAYVVLANPVTREAYDRYLAFVAENPAMMSQHSQTRPARQLQL